MVESRVCLNDPLYVTTAGDMSMLTEYGRLHVDECCLKFAVVADVRHKEWAQYFTDGLMYRTDELAVRFYFVRKEEMGGKVWSPLGNPYNASGSDDKKKNSTVSHTTQVDEPNSDDDIANITVHHIMKVRKNYTN